MSIAIRFVGGPADGRTMTFAADSPSPRYVVPMPEPLSALLANPEPAPLRVAEYEPLREGGWPRRADDGAYLYGHRPAPVLAEERQALEEARQKAQAAEEARAADLDAAWREIREVRPHFPEDRRDLF